MMHRPPYSPRPVAPRNTPCRHAQGTTAQEAAASPLLQALVAQYLRPRTDPCHHADPGLETYVTGRPIAANPSNSRP